MGSLCSCLCPDKSNQHDSTDAEQSALNQPLIKNQDPKISIESFNIETLIG